MTATKRRRWNVQSLRIRSAFLDASPRFPCRWRRRNRPGRWRHRSTPRRQRPPERRTCLGPPDAGWSCASRWPRRWRRCTRPATQAMSPTVSNAPTMLDRVLIPGRPVELGDTSATTPTALTPMAVMVVTMCVPSSELTRARAARSVPRSTDGHGRPHRSHARYVSCEIPAHPRCRIPERPPAVKLAQVWTITPCSGSVAESTSPSPM